VVEALDPVDPVPDGDGPVPDAGHLASMAPASAWPRARRASSRVILAWMRATSLGWALAWAHCSHPSSLARRAAILPSTFWTRANARGAREHFGCPCPTAGAGADGPPDDPPEGAAAAAPTDPTANAPVMTIAAPNFMNTDPHFSWSRRRPIGSMPMGPAWTGPMR